MSDLSALLEALHYRPDNLELIRQALTHRSYSKNHNERLEFIGDALLDLVVGQALYEQFPDKPEGELSRFRAELVKGETLAKLATQLSIGEFVRLGQGERKSGGAERQSILANTFEALIGAAYLQDGFEASRRMVLTIFAERLSNVENLASSKDAKTALQEFLQARKKALPLYQLEQTKGQQHKQTFLISCYVADYDLKVDASGRSKKLAEQQAAALMLEQLTAREAL